MKMQEACQFTADPTQRAKNLRMRRTNPRNSRDFLNTEVQDQGTTDRLTVLTGQNGTRKRSDDFKFITLIAQ